jgi:O-methyltransferase
MLLRCALLKSLTAMSTGKQEITMLKKIVQNTFNTLGYEIRRVSKNISDRSMPVELNDSEREIVHYIMSNKLTMVSYERLWTTVMACKYVVDREIEGDFVECGVWRGGNALAAAEIFKLHNSKRNVWLFDTFKGMTAPTDFDVQASDGRTARTQYEADQKETHNEWCYSSIEDVRQNFANRGLTTNIHFVQGDVCQTLNSEPSKLPNKISVLRLDTDWYESTKKELEVLYPKLTVGGCLIIDDYGHWSGSKKATDEYFEKNQNRPFLQHTDYTGRVAVKVS